MKSKWYKKYRVMRDGYLGFQVECWRIWFPIWIQVDGCNTHRTIGEAAEWLDNYLKNGNVVARL